MDFTQAINLLNEIKSAGKGTYSILTHDDWSGIIVGQECWQEFDNLQDLINKLQQIKREKPMSRPGVVDI